jgi:hypothetical protein
MTQTDRLTGFDLGAAIKVPARVASTGNLTLYSTQTIDGVAVSTGDRVLVKDQTTGTENGVYIVNASTWSRASDYDGNRDAVRGTIVLVNAGTVSALSIWRQNSTGTNSDGSIKIGTDASSFVQINSPLSGASAYGQTLTASTDAAAARVILGAAGTTAAGDAIFRATSTAAVKTILGMGTASTVDTGSSGHVLPFLDTVNRWTAAQYFVPVALTSSNGAITPDLSTSLVFTHTLTAASTLQMPSNPVAGMNFVINLLQGSSTNYALTYSSHYRFGGGSTGSTAIAIGTVVNSRAQFIGEIISTSLVFASITNYGV